jgi:arsenical pump membrane protein
MIIACSAVAARLGLFRALARLLMPDGSSRVRVAASVLMFTALLAGLVNLDVAVVVAMPVALQAGEHHGLPADRLTAAVAVTANATSFLLPTSNITTLLLIGRAPLAPLAYLRGAWLAWLLVLAVTVIPLSAFLAGNGDGAPGQRGTGRGGPSARALLDLIPMFVTAAAIRAILASGIALRGGLAAQLASGTAIACLVNNLPAAAALRPGGTSGLWAAILATAIGPGLLVTGSVATLICRRIGREAGATLAVRQFTAIGLLLVPVQLAAAVIGLHLTGAL